MYSFPFVSVVVPAFNEEQYVARCLESLKNVDYPENKYEIILVDNGSTDNTVNVAKKLGVKVLVKPLVNVGAVRNYGVEESTGSILAFVDADCTVPSRWLKSAIEILECKAGVGAVGGGCLVPANSTWVEKTWVLESNEDVESSNSLPGASFIMNRDLFLSLNGFDEAIVAGEDDDLSNKIKSKGFELIKHKDCYVEHLGYPKTLSEIMKRQVWHGKNQLEVADGITDKMLLFTHCFLMSFLLLGFSPLMIQQTGFSIVLLPFLLLFFVVFLTSFHRIKKYPDGRNFLTHCPKLMSIYFFFFTGRMFGLLYNYKKLLLRR